MAALTGLTPYEVVPNLGVKTVLIKTAATADSADTIDVSSATVTGGPKFSAVWMARAWDATTGDSVTVTVSSTTLTIDAAGATTDHTYYVEVTGLTA